MAHIMIPCLKLALVWNTVNSAWCWQALNFWFSKWAATWQNQQSECAPNELRSAWASAQSDQSSLCTQWVAKDPQLSSCRQLRLWPDWADAQADLRLRWAHTHFVGFVMSLLKLCVLNLPLYPSNTKSTIGLAVSLYMSTCLESGA